MFDYALLLHFLFGRTFIFDRRVVLLLGDHKIGSRAPWDSKGKGTE